MRYKDGQKVCNKKGEVITILEYWENGYTINKGNSKTIYWTQNSHPKDPMLVNGFMPISKVVNIRLKYINNLMVPIDEFYNFFMSGDPKSCGTIFQTAKEVAVFDGYQIESKRQSQQHYTFKNYLPIYATGMLSGLLGFKSLSPKRINKRIFVEDFQSFQNFVESEFEMITNEIRKAAHIIGNYSDCLSYIKSQSEIIID